MSAVLQQPVLCNNGWSAPNLLRGTQESSRLSETRLNPSISPAAAAGQGSGCLLRQQDSPSCFSAHLFDSLHGPFLPTHQCAFIIVVCLLKPLLVQFVKCTCKWPCFFLCEALETSTALFLLHCFYFEGVSASGVLEGDPLPEDPQ